MQAIHDKMKNVCDRYDNAQLQSLMEKSIKVMVNSMSEERFCNRERPKVMKLVVKANAVIKPF
jgi:hypothetical protein